MADTRSFYLKEYRERAGLTLEALAEAVGTSKGYIQQIESGKRRYNQDWLERLADALEVAPWELLQPPAISDKTDAEDEELSDVIDWWDSLAKSDRRLAHTTVKHLAENQRKLRSGK